MAWQWVSISKKSDEMYVIVAEDSENPGTTVSIEVNRERIDGPTLVAELPNILQQKVDELKAAFQDIEDKLSWIQTSVDISGVS